MCFNMVYGVGSAMVAQRIVIPLVASSSLVLHPIGLLTQLVECLPYTQNVGGSNPSQPTIYTQLAQLVEHNLDKVGVSGSNPLLGTRCLQSFKVKQRTFNP